MHGSGDLTALNKIKQTNNLISSMHLVVNFALLFLFLLPLCRLFLTNMKQNLGYLGLAKALPLLPFFLLPPSLFCKTTPPPPSREWFQTITYFLLQLVRERIESYGKQFFNKSIRLG